MTGESSRGAGKSTAGVRRRRQFADIGWSALACAPAPQRRSQPVRSSAASRSLASIRSPSTSRSLATTLERLGWSADDPALREVAPTAPEATTSSWSRPRPRPTPFPCWPACSADSARGPAASCSRRPPSSSSGAARRTAAGGARAADPGRPRHRPRHAAAQGRRGGPARAPRRRPRWRCSGGRPSGPRRWSPSCLAWPESWEDGARASPRSCKTCPRTPSASSAPRLRSGPPSWSSATRAGR